MRAKKNAMGKFSLHLLPIKFGIGNAVYYIIQQQQHMQAEVALAVKIVFVLF